MIGDSYMIFDPTAMPILYTEELARAAGALAANESYEFYAVPGTSMGTGEILGQFTAAAGLLPDIKLVIMDGGGNDVLVWNRGCLEPGSAANPTCHAAIQDAIDVSVQGMTDMADSGVSDVIYFFYPHLPGGGLGGPAPNEILDYAYPLVEETCTSANERTGGRLTCHFIDLRDPFEGHTTEYVGIDGVHPTPAGGEVIGQEIWRTMEENCVGQAEASGCCAP